MKKFRVGRWGQIHLLGEEKSDAPTRLTVRSVFFVIVALMMVVVFVVTGL
jgi:hypothetical protein